MSLITDVASELQKVKADRKALRNFGITMAIALAILGTLLFFFGHHSQRAYWLWGVGALFLLFGFVMPMILKPIHKVWMGLAFVLGWFVSRIILIILFYLVIMPIGILMKLLGKDLLHRKIDKNASTYWLKRDVSDDDPKKYEKLF